MSRISTYMLKLEEKGEIEFNDELNRYVWTDHDNPDNFSIFELMGEALMAEGWAFELYVSEGTWYVRTNPDAEHNSAFDSRLDPFAESQDGYEEAFALEDHLISVHRNLWAASSKAIARSRQGNHNWRVRRIYWCFKQLLNEERS